MFASYNASRAKAEVLGEMATGEEGIKCERRTSNVERRTLNVEVKKRSCLYFDVGSSTFDVRRSHFSFGNNDIAASHTIPGVTRVMQR